MKPQVLLVLALVAFAGSSVYAADPAPQLHWCRVYVLFPHGDAGGRESTGSSPFDVTETYKRIISGEPVILGDLRKQEAVSSTGSDQPVEWVADRELSRVILRPRNGLYRLRIS